jgi:predicted ribosomally synthesized peptide with nif11-like leader
MSEVAAREFVSRVEGDGTFARELEALKDDPQAVLARVHAEGFDADPVEIGIAFVERFGAELSLEQLDTVAAGLSDSDLIAAVVGGTSITIGAVGVAVVAAGVAL